MFHECGDTCDLFIHLCSHSTSFHLTESRSSNFDRIIWMKITLVSYMIYLLLGIVGLPVFSGLTGGLSVIIGPTGGYLIGFAFLIIVSSALINVLGRGIFSLTLAFTVGVIVLYVIATVYYSAVWLKDTSLSSVISSASVCVLPFLLVDAAKTALAVYIVKCFEGRLRV